TNIRAKVDKYSWFLVKLPLPRSMSSIDDVSNVFGEKILDYSLSLCQGHYDYLDRIQDDLLLKIMSFLQLKDRFVLAQLSKRFNMLCNSEKFWELTVKNDCPDYHTDMEDLAKAMGWKEQENLCQKQSPHRQQL
uniref:F-box domain-containing protein n=1 Tax=Poecilia mexicana TaxID=48701 RepID=A0A3B3XTQ4_9TELE